jgi:Low affinity iron permease
MRVCIDGTPFPTAVVTRLVRNADMRPSVDLNATPLAHAYRRFNVPPARVRYRGVYVALWLILIFKPESFGWGSIATVATWVMTLFIQRAETRDTLAIHAKLDELLRAEHHARKELTTLDQKEPEEIARHRARAQKRS